MQDQLKAISPIDGRYHKTTESLVPFFSEYALIKYRVKVEVEYFISLCELPLPQLRDFPGEEFTRLREICANFSPEQAATIKGIERTTNHDVKAVEYFLKTVFREDGLEKYAEFIHFGLTSQDINNTAIPLSVKESLEQVLLPQLDNIIGLLREKGQKWADIPMLARTHGQPASPTRLGKEIDVFTARLEGQLRTLKEIPHAAKFGGATGNMNAHFAAYPDTDWHDFAGKFAEKLGLKRSHPTTQIEHYDHLAALFDNIKRINTILLDLDRDMWTYISMDYFKQQIKDGEVGSSAMPHKINPIDFENSEGNIGLANALFEHLSSKLPVSRLQRDLTDSTVLRNIGTPFGHTLIALSSLEKGLKKLKVNRERIQADLDSQWSVVAEALQTIMRREGYKNPYESLKALTRTHGAIDREGLHNFIDELDLPEKVKAEMKEITPSNYTGQ